MRTVVFLSPRSRSSTFPSPPEAPSRQFMVSPSPAPGNHASVFHPYGFALCRASHKSNPSCAASCVWFLSSTTKQLAGRPASPGHRERSGPWPRAGSEGRGAHAAQGLLSATAATPGFTAGVMEATGIPSAAEEGDLNNLKIILATVWEADHSRTKAGKGKPVQRPRQPSGLKAGRRCARW